MRNEKVLIVEDDAEIRHLIQLYLEKEYQVIMTENGKKAIEVIKLDSPDLILLDILLPGKDGLEVCREIRTFNVDVPIIFLSSRREYEDRIFGLEAGADDYITKPFDPGEVLARVRAHLRRKEIAARRFDVNQTVRRFGDLEINMDNYTVHRSGELIQLYAKEMQLLLFLVKNSNQVFSIDQLYDQIWGEDKLGDYRTVKVHISNLRRKIEKLPENPSFIQTIRGFGYKFTPKN